MKMKKETIFLTLGDGDFSYSLDLARYLSSASHNITSNNIRLVATGLDSRKTLLEKYKDAPFLLKQIEKLNETKTIYGNFLFTEIYHGINAIECNLKNIEKNNADHVIFNHPHLGTENATLHSQFLCHLLYSAANNWINSGNACFYLTLCRQQYERWRGPMAAHRAGLILCSRATFQPPPVESPYFQYRRHQSGKSFVSRRPSDGSETLKFTRQPSNDTGSAAMMSLPWQNGISTPEENLKRLVDVVTLPCPHCDRIFTWENSRLNHIKSKHSEPSTTKPLHSFQHICQACHEEDNKPRIFASEQAMKEHIRVKHAGMYKTILPDWHLLRISTSNQPVLAKNQQAESFASSCSICECKFMNPQDQQKHELIFTPGETNYSFRCRFCNKLFRENRATMQHENYCSTRVGGVP